MISFDAKCENDVLTLFLNGRIDSANVSEAENAANAAIGQFPHTALIFDAQQLSYLSSAGLRFILKWRKQEPSLKIVNVNSEVYEIFEMTGFTEMLPVQKAFRCLSVEGCPVIGQGAKGTVYRYNADTIVKVYKNPDSLPDIRNERELARKAFVLGIPTAISYDIVRVGTSYGSVFELLEARSYSELIRNDAENRDRYIAEYAALLKKIHATEVRAEDMPDIKIFVLDWLKTAAPFLSEGAAEKLEHLINATPDTLHMLHCDYHTNNVLSQNGETLLIDMDTLSHGHPVFELANIYITYVGFGLWDPAVVENFLKMPYETACYIWKTFLPLYLGTEDASVLNAVSDKVRLISLVRLIRHTVRRGGAETEEGRRLIADCREEIEQLLSRVDTLTF